MNFLIPMLCCVVLFGGLACTKRPNPLPANPPARSGEPFEEDVRIMPPDPNEKVLDLSDRTPTGVFYFDFDGYALKDVDRAAVLARYLARHPEIVVDLAGHTSQEGTTDYNLALGARRAQTLRAYLEAAGVPENRVNWKSFGEESPVTDDPAAYWKNRRVEFFLEDAK